MSGSTTQLADGRVAELVKLADSVALDVSVDGLETLITATNAALIPNTTAASGIAPSVTSALATSKVLKASAGNLYSLNMQATTVAGIFLLHDATSAPAAGAVTPVRAWPVGIGQGIDLTFKPPLRLGTGISVTFTSAATPYTQTDSATAFIAGEAV